MKKYMLVSMSVFVLLSAAVITAQDMPDLIAPAKAGRVLEIDAALKKGADINQRDENGATAIMWVSLRGYKDAAALLLLYKPDLNNRDNRGSTALHWAAMRGKKEQVKMLLDAGALAISKDDAGKDPAAVAEENSYFDIAKMIRGFIPAEKKAVPHTAAVEKATLIKPLDAAAEEPKKEVPAEEIAKDAVSSLSEYYPAKSGDSWVMKNMHNGVITSYYVIDSSAGSATIQCESKSGGRRTDYYKQQMIYAENKLKVTALSRDEILLQLPLKAGTKWFVEKNGQVSERLIVSADASVAFAGTQYPCVITRDIVTLKTGSARGGVKKEVHYHFYAKGAGYLGTKTASFEKAGDVEFIPSYSDISSWFLVRGRSQN